MRRLLDKIEAFIIARRQRAIHAAVAPAVRAFGGGAVVYGVNQELFGFGAAINFQLPITPLHGGRILAIGYITARCTGEGTIVATKLRRNGMLLPDANVPMVSVNDSGTSINDNVSGLVFAVDSPQPAGVAATYSVTMATSGQTVGAGPGQMALLLLELG
jgi:hypothetical protein